VAPRIAFRFLRRISSAPIVSRDVEAPGEADEMTVAEIDEQRRQEEARHQT
jgi:hypothetical protein